MSARTPGPWLCDGSRIFYQQNVGGMKVWIGELLSDHQSIATRKANAAFIVEACNAHDDLIAQRDVLAEALRIARITLQVIASKSWSSLCANEAAQEMSTYADSTLERIDDLSPKVTR